jgi:hypothetical protein
VLRRYPGILPDQSGSANSPHRKRCPTGLTNARRDQNGDRWLARFRSNHVSSSGEAPTLQFDAGRIDSLENCRRFRSHHQRHAGAGRPEFYFYFENKGSGLSNTGSFSGFMSGTSSSNEFILARLKSDSKERNLLLGEIGAFGASNGAGDENIVEFTGEELASGVYKVTPKPLEQGEYAFFYAADTAALGASTAGKLFDFGTGGK